MLVCARVICAIDPPCHFEVCVELGLGGGWLVSGVLLSARGCSCWLVLVQSENGLTRCMLLLSIVSWL